MVTITGTNFTGTTQVDFGSVSATSFTVNSNTSITATAPAEAAGIVDITVTKSGTSAAGAADHYTYQAPQPPTLAPIASQTDTAGLPLAVTLQGSDPDGDTLTYAASAETQTYWLQQTFGFYEDQGGYYTNDRGQEEVYLRAKVSVNGYNTGGMAPWYYILPNGSLYEFTPSYANPALDGVLVAQLGAAVYNDPSLLWTAREHRSAGHTGGLGEPVNDRSRRRLHRHLRGCRHASDGQSVATSSFTVTVSQPPTLAPIASQTDTAGLPLAVTLQGSDPDGDTLTYAASAETQTYWLQQTFGFYEDQGGNYTNDRGQEEEYLRAKVSVNGYNTGGIDPWYYILPNGASTSSLLRTRIRA